MVVHARVLAADLDVALHDVPALLRGQRVPLARLHERVDEHVPAAEAPRHQTFVLGVLRALAHPQERVGDLRPPHQAALCEHDVELVDAVEVLRLRHEQQLRVAARTHEREALQQVPVGEVLARGRELALVRVALLPLPAPPGRIELRNVYLTKRRGLTCVIIAAAPGGPPGPAIELGRADRPPVAVLLELPRRRHPPHRRARPRARGERATRRGYSPPSTPTTSSPEGCTAARGRSRARPRRVHLARSHRRRARERRRLQHGADAALDLQPYAASSGVGATTSCTSTSPWCPSLGWDALCTSASCRWWEPSTPTPRTSSRTASPPSASAAGGG